MKFITLICLAFNFTAFAQKHDHNHSLDVNTLSVSKQDPNLPQNLGASSIQLLQKEIELTDGYGRGWYFETPTSDVEKYVNQGFAMLNLFQYTDAFRSFNTALNTEPESSIALIGRAFSSIFLDSRESYYLQITQQKISDQFNTGALNQKDQVWADFLFSLIYRKDLSGQNSNASITYQSLKQKDSGNLEVYTFANWVSNSYDIADMNFALSKDAQNVGALHYLLHLSEGQNDHSSALSYAEKLVPIATESAHAQHMYGHVLPHFNRWAEADKQFTIADDLHNQWAAKNAVPASEDWHYSHNLDLWAVSKMVVDPSNALKVLSAYETVNPGAILETLDFLISYAPANQSANVERNLLQVEAFNDDYKNYVLSSRLYFDFLYKENKADLVGFEQKISSIRNFKNKEILSASIALVNANLSGNKALSNQIITQITNQLSNEFSRGGFDGWKKSVLETLMYKRIFENLNLTEELTILESKVISVYMNPK